MKKEANATKTNHVFEMWCQCKFMMMILSKYEKCIKRRDTALSEHLLIKFLIIGQSHITRKLGVFLNNDDSTLNKVSYLYKK